MSNARGGNDGEGPSGSKSFEANCEEFLEYSQDWNLAGPVQRPELLIRPQTQAFQPIPMYDNNNSVVLMNEILILVTLSWSRGGNQVEVMGSWDNWTSRDQLHREGNGFFVVKALPPGEYQYIFIVDGYLRCAPDSPWTFASGNAFNVLDLQDRGSELPHHLSEFETPESPPSSYNNELLNEDDYNKPPPDAPRLLENEPSSSNGQMPLPDPQQFNHLFIQNHTKFIGLRTTSRFRQKLVTMVLYKPTGGTS